MKKGYHNHNGFTLLEILLVIGISAVLLAVIIPQAIRVNTSSKYTLVRQAAAELGKWGVEWGTRNLESQPPAATCVLNDYIATLGNSYTGQSNTGNWVNVNNTLTSCRGNGQNIRYSVADMVGAGRQPRNPFNGISYLAPANDGTSMIVGLLYLAHYSDNSTNPPTHHYYFVYTGTDSANASTWHAGMGSGTPPQISNMRNGIFMTRLVQ